MGSQLRAPRLRAASSGNREPIAPHGLREDPSILVVKLDDIGDFVTALPALRRLRDAWPKATITLLCAELVRPLAETELAIDHIVALEPPRTGSRRKWGDLSPADFGPGWTLADRHFDLAIDLRHDGNTRAWLWRVEADIRAGFASAGFTDRLDIVLPELEKSARNSGARGLDNRTRLTLLVEAVIATLLPFAPVRDRTPPVPGLPDRYAVIGPMAKWETKAWPNERWEQLVCRFRDAGMPVVILGRTPADRSLAALALPTGDPGILDRIDRTSLAEAHAILRRAAVFVGVDDGLAHLASSLGVPSVVLFSGHADSDVWAPRAAGTILLQAGSPCSPCHLRKLKDCRFGHRCMQDLSIDRAWQSVESALAEV